MNRYNIGFMNCRTRRPSDSARIIVQRNSKQRRRSESTRIPLPRDDSRSGGVRERMRGPSRALPKNRKCHQDLRNECGSTSQRGHQTSAISHQLSALRLGDVMLTKRLSWWSDVMSWEGFLRSSSSIYLVIMIITGS